jgi:hypothetical protein
MMSTLRLTIQKYPSFSWHRPWLYASVLGVVSLLLVLNFLALPLIAQSYEISISPTVPQAESETATSNLLASFNAQNFTAQPLDSVTHSYLTGRGTIFVLAGDNIQIFEYPDVATAREEAFAIFKRVPRLAIKSYFHIFLSGNLIGLYIGHNPVVLQITEEEMGPPLTNPYASTVTGG